jgi:hypothetical protein
MLQNYFAGVLGRIEDTHWLEYLRAGQTEKAGNAADVLKIHSEKTRNMWCTAGFLHAAGQTVTPAGEIVPLNSNHAPLYTFDPVQVTVAPTGHATWQPTPNARHHLFHIHDPANYQQAMTTALRTLLTAP